ncbi:class I SAM-dependent methyltransferase [Acidiferrimicrobium sp. IK]|uniref:class I SAM-dependent methyltransferase n=1 Tax=Acidiferrimicrobium sp. IK TaxID=2871700 RepID=UPI0021CB106A|nr:class I SAM-dependent methyltransferase [Acidiferrimicrobium sp. IK]MCU4185524.1 class I SAM-dependent methyltransferase [Acidiferrimicrobium sp. IK]
MDAAAWDARYATADLVWTGDANQFVAAEAADLPPGRALDLAAGEGRNAIWLAERGWTVTAVDFSAVGLAKGEKIADKLGLSGRIEWVCADATAWDPTPGTYDLVIVAYLHLPAPDLEAVMRRAALAVAGGGRLIAVGHDLANLEGGVGGPQDPAILWRAPKVAAWLADAGLSVLHAGVVARDTGSGRAVDTLVTAAGPAPADPAS